MGYAGFSWCFVEFSLDFLRFSWDFACFGAGFFLGFSCGFCEGFFCRRALYGVMITELLLVDCQF